MKETRTCVACRKTNDKSNLIRVVKNDNGIFIEEDEKIFGRGAYVCKDKNCIDLAIKKRLFNKSFRTNIDISFYEKLEEYGQTK